MSSDPLGDPATLLKNPTKERAHMPFPNHQLSMTVLMTPDMANFSGKVHGGHVLKLLDQVAYACASRYTGMYVVTLSVDRVLFRQPIRVGELVTFLASVNYTGTSSIEVGIKVVSEDIHKGIVTHTNSCFFTMVATNEEGKPASVSPFIPETVDEKRRHKAAQLRKQLRVELEKRYADAMSNL
jgi:acyl-CoA hydrolase